MKDREFIELLNLYVDGEIAAEDAARLEAEVLADPKRRQLYRQYCQIQKACSSVALTTEGQSMAQVIEIPRSLGYRWALSACAAAACVAAFVAVRVHRAPVVAAPVLARVEPAPRREPMQAVYVTHPLVSPRSDVLFASARSQSDLSWLSSVQMTPLTPLQLVPPSEARSDFQIEDRPWAESEDPARVEMTAFRFRR